MNKYHINNAIFYMFSQLRWATLSYPLIHFNVWIFFSLFSQVWWTTARCLATPWFNTGRFARCYTTSNSISGSSPKVTFSASLITTYAACYLFKLEKTVLCSLWHKSSCFPREKKNSDQLFMVSQLLWHIKVSCSSTASLLCLIFIFDQPFDLQAKHRLLIRLSHLHYLGLP